VSDVLFENQSDGAPGDAAALIVGWRGDSARLGSGVVDYLRGKLQCREGGRIALEPFFSFDGVNVETNLIRFPENRLYAGTGERALLFVSDPPHYEWYDYLNAVIDNAQQVAGVGALFTLGCMVSLGSHTQPRDIFMVFNSETAKKRFASGQQERNIDYQTPPDQKPTLNSYLLWVARRRNIPGVSLWVPVPFYLATVGDRSAEKMIVSFFSRTLHWQVDVSDLDRAVRRQHAAIDKLRSDNQEVDEYLARLECRRDLTEEENLKLMKAVEEGLSGTQ
jgi:predicted ATP-grasp superfamily ATP-dependent carboligase